MSHRFHTSSSSTTHSPRHNLPRGKACMNCRRRKIKCDGRKPVCSQCLRSPGTTEDCEYPLEGRSRTQQLEETIKKLQSRVNELEAAAAANDGHSVLLHEPYEALHEVYDSCGISVELPPTLSLEMSPFAGSWPGGGSPSSVSGAPSPSSRVPTPSSPSSSSSFVLEEPPPDVIEQLIDTFLSHFLSGHGYAGFGFGFFLNSQTFRDSALLLGLPFGHYERPSRALLSAVYMWGAYLTNLNQTPTSAPLHPLYSASAFLSVTLQNIHGDLANGHPHRIMHTIQAEVLLALYYLELGRPVEGVYHSTAAVSLAMSAGLHRIRPFSHSNSSSNPKMFKSPFMPMPGPLLPPPRNALEEGERINAFWTVAVVNNYWVVAHGGAPSAIAYADTLIETPWPRPLEGPGDYRPPEVTPDAQGYVSPNDATAPDYQHLLDVIAGAITSNSSVAWGTVGKFLAGNTFEGYSNLALLAKASILLERACALGDSSRHSNDSRTNNSFEALDVLLQQFLLNLPLEIDVGPAQSHYPSSYNSSYDSSYDASSYPNSYDQNYDQQSLPMPSISKLRRSSSLIVTQTIAHAAIIRLHAQRIHTSQVSRTKCTAAAKAVVNLINTTDFSSWTAGEGAHVDPIMGILWSMVCDVFVSCMHGITAVGHLTQEHQDMVASLETVLRTIRMFTGNSPLLAYCSSRAEQAYNAVSNGSS